MFHLLIDVDGPAPDKLTFPYHYKPHAWTRRAAEIVYTHLNRTANPTQGRLVGILVTKDKSGSIGFYAGCDFIKTNDAFFVQSFWEQIPAEEVSEVDYSELEKATLASQSALKSYEQFQLEAKARKQARRLSRTDSSISNDTLNRESIADSAALSYLKRALYQARSNEAALRNRWLKEKEATQQRDWRRRLETVTLTNYKAQSSTLWDLLGPLVDDVDKLKAVLSSSLPALIHAAQSNGHILLAMGSVWWGKSPFDDTRHEGVFYGFPKERHAPLLDFMLDGIDVENNPLAQDLFANWTLDIVYEDKWLIAVNKPAGLLSVPGKEPITNLFALVSKYCHDKGEEALLIHRLDMATSGLLVFAKTKQAHRTLQENFARSHVNKCYVALLEKRPAQLQGEIRLPLCLNPMERPRQIVSDVYGKEALTHYEVIGESHGFTRVAFYPVTGRTHQLRVHAAHEQGLGAPIVGDDLYGHPAERLYLHAQTLTFIHPITEQRMTIEAQTPF